jgi:hypothetical protein
MSRTTEASAFLDRELLFAHWLVFPPSSPSIAASSTIDLDECVADIVCGPLLRLYKKKEKKDKKGKKTIDLDECVAAIVCGPLLRLYKKKGGNKDKH